MEFNQFLGMDQEVPIFIPGQTPSLENVGTGDNSQLTFYFDNNNIISDSETLYIGVSEGSATTSLARTTQYTVTNDSARINIVSPAGKTALGTNTIFANYFYNKFGIKNSRVSSALLAAEADVDREVNTVFTDNTVSAPAFVSVVNEIHEGKGDFLRVYSTDFYPLNPIQAVVSGAVSSGSVTLPVTTTTNGFANSGYLGVNNLKLSYTGKTSNSFTGVSGLSADIADASIVTNWVIERSLTPEGTDPTYDVLAYQSDYDIETETGNVKLNRNAVVGTLLYDSFQPGVKIWNRVRFTYNYGYTETPKDIVRCVYLIAGKDLFGSQVLNALGRGTNGFETGSMSEIDAWIKQTLNHYKCVKISNLN